MQVTRALYTGNVAASEVITVLEPFKVFTVGPEVDVDERKIIKFAKRNIPYYNPKAGYAYYEFTGHMYIYANRNIMALNKVFIYKLPSLYMQITIIIIITVI